ncbi:ADOP family duplicated permease [Gemmatimonadota bacterium DH-20]|uniref:ADOP family duplicated permease n=1 Tax=Gaopeijia maritima TaxID=3119007 RepID=A0ABU9EAH2_9BACT
MSTGPAGSGPSLPPALEQLVADTLDAADLGGPAAREVGEELRDHLHEALAAGRSIADIAASFGDPARTGARIARARRPDPDPSSPGSAMTFETLVTELRRAVRTLARAPGFAALVILTLALGVGANTAVFTVLDAVLLQPLPYQEPDRLVQMFSRWGDEPSDVSDYLRAPTIRTVSEWDDLFEGFASIYTYREAGRDLIAPGAPPERVVASIVSAGWFETLGVRPALGRTFHPDESTGPGVSGTDPAPRVALLSHALWQRRFGGDPAVIGRTIDLSDESWEVVGVMPAGYTDPLGPRADLWLPQDLRDGGSNHWGNYYLTGVGRMSDGLTLEALQERFDARWAGLVEANPDAGGSVIEFRSLEGEVVGPQRAAMLWILSAAVALVLLSACVNVANLVFARSLARDREVAVRGALGSGRSRLVAHLLSESVVLAAAGGALGLLIGWVGVGALLRLAPEALPTVAEPQLSGRVFLFSLGTTALAVLAFGLAPALRSARTPAAAALRAGGRGGTEGRGLRRVRDGLVVAQVAVALVLVVGAGLLLRSFDTLLDVPLAIHTDDVVTFEVHLPTRRYADGAARHRLHEALGERIDALPEVEASGATSWLPASGRYHSWGVRWNPDGGEDLPDDGWMSSDMRVVTAGYLDALEVTVVRGQSPAEVDPEGEPMAWVNETLAARVFGDVDPIGQRMFAGEAFRRVMGVVADVPHDVRGALSPKTYLLHDQFADNRNWALTWAVRLQPGSDPAAAVESMRSELAGLDPVLVLYRPRSLDGLLATRRAQDRFATTLMGIFAGLALALAVVGTYGVLSGAVARRRREIGIRMALGADPGRVRSMVLRSAAALVATGLILGAVGAWWSGRWISSLLFEVAPADPAAWAIGVTLLAGLGLLAGWLPARRATRVDPARTLGAE